MAIEHTGSDPVRIWGDLSTTYRVLERGSGDSRRTNWRNTGSVSASRYIWRPWFAVASGSLNLSVEETRDDDQPDSDSQFTTGDARFALFPTSRFPFNAYVIESRDEFDRASGARDVKTTEYGLKQRYRTIDGKHNYLAEYENKRQDPDIEDEFVFENLGLSAINRFGDNTIETDLDLDTIDNTELNEEGSSEAITIDHTYDPNSTFSLDNLLSNTVAESDVTETSREIEIAQLVSFLSWNPGNRNDLRLTGTMRASETRNQVDFLDSSTRDSIDNEILNANLTQGLIYDYTDALQFNQSINSNYTDAEGETTTVMSEALGVRYSPARVVTRLGDYGWAASSTYFNQHGDIDSAQSLESQFNHSLTNDFSRPNRYRLTTDLTQSLFYDYESDESDEKSLDHTYTATWSNGASRNQNLVRFDITDSRELNDDNDYFQLLNLQYSGSIRIDRYSQFSGDLTLQLTEQKEGGDRSKQQLNDGRLLYRHNRAFQVNGLSFLSELQVNRRKTEVERLIQDDESDTEISLENTLLYQVGKLEAEFALDIVRVDGEYDRLAKFRLTRSFGDL